MEYNPEDPFYDFIKSNLLMIRYLSEKFNDHPDVLNLIKCSLEQAILTHPNFTITKYKKAMSNSFDNIYGRFKRSDLPGYIKKSFSHEFSEPSKNIESEYIKRNIEKDDLINMTKFAACTIYSRLKSYDIYSKVSSFESYDIAFRRALYFHLFSKNIFSHNTPLYYSGKVWDVVMRTSLKGNPYARILVHYDTEGSFYAVVRSWLYYQVYDGLKVLDNTKASFLGTVIKDSFTDRLALDVQEITIERNGKFEKYPNSK